MADKIKLAERLSIAGDAFRIGLGLWVFYSVFTSTYFHEVGQVAVYAASLWVLSVIANVYLDSIAIRWDNDDMERQKAAFIRNLERSQTNGG